MILLSHQVTSHIFIPPNLKEDGSFYLVVNSKFTPEGVHSCSYRHCWRNDISRGWLIFSAICVANTWEMYRLNLTACSLKHAKRIIWELEGIDEND